MADGNLETGKVLNSLKAIMSYAEFFKDKYGSIGIRSTAKFGDLVSKLLDIIGVEEYVKKATESGFLTSALEATVKTILHTKLMGMSRCTVAPFITYNMVMDGAYFDISAADLDRILQHTPPVYGGGIGKGGDLYFDCADNKDVKSVEDLYKSRDLNAVMWYAKNHPGERVVWKREGDNPDVFQMTSTGISAYTVKKDGKKGVILCFEKSDAGGGTVYKDKDGNIVARMVDGNVECEAGYHGFKEKSVTFNKQPLSNGIITMEYTSSPAGLEDFEHNAMATPVPVTNCMHVFYGCARPLIEGDTLSYTEEIKKCNEAISKYNRVIAQAEKVIKSISAFEDNDAYSSMRTQIKNLKKKAKALKDAAAGTSSKKLADIPGGSSRDGSLVHVFACAEEYFGTVSVPDDAAFLESSKKEQGRTKAGYEYTLSTLPGGNYPDVESCYYYGRTLWEFNAEYLNNTRLFDNKTLAARIREALKTCLVYNSPGVSVTFDTTDTMSGYIESLVSDIYDKYVESTTAITSAFSDRQKMYERQRQRWTENDSDGRSIFVRKGGTDWLRAADEIMREAAGIVGEAERYGGAAEMLGSVWEEIEKTDARVSVFGFGAAEATPADAVEDFASRLFKKIAAILTNMVLSPKVYMLVMLNMSAYGYDTGGIVDARGLVAKCGDIVTELVNGIISDLFRLLVDMAADFVRKAAADWAVVLTSEQLSYFLDILAQLMPCLTLVGGQGWSQDDVNYADIENTDKEDR